MKQTQWTKAKHNNQKQIQRMLFIDLSFHDWIQKTGKDNTNISRYSYFAKMPAKLHTYINLHYYCNCKGLF